MTISALGTAVLFGACSSATTPTAEKPSGGTSAPTKPAETKPAVNLAATPTPVPLLPPVPQPAGTTKILLRVHWSGANFNEFQKILNEYNETQGPQDKIYVALERFVAGQAGPIATFIADFQAGTQEDIYHLSDSYLADLSARGFFSTPPQEVQNYIKENYLSSAVENGTVEGKVMGYPTENQPHMFFLNKKLFEEGGLDATTGYPKTWDDIRTIAKQLTKKDASGQKIQAGFLVHDTAGERIHTQRLLFQFLAGEPLVDTSVTPPKYNFTSDAARQFTELLAGMAQDDSVSAGMGTHSVLWGQRKGAMITHDAWAVVFQLRNEGIPGIVDEQHTIPVFSPDGSKTGNLSRNYHYLVSAKSQQKELAWNFLKWMNEGPDFRMQRFMTHQFGFVASVKDYEMPSVFPEQMKQAFTESLNTPLQTSYPVIRGLSEVMNIMRDNHDALTLKQMTADDYTTRVDEEVKKALEQAYSE